MRKVYHLLAMGLFVPVFFWDLQLLALSLAVAFAVLVLLEVLRCIRVPLLGWAVQDFMQVRLAVGSRRSLAAGGVCLGGRDLAITAVCALLRVATGMQAVSLLFCCCCCAGVCGRA